MLEKQWLISQGFANMFWRRWLHEYLPTLNPRRKWNQTDVNVKIGDIVLVLDDKVPRNEWRKGVVRNVFPSKDGQIRMAEIQTANGLLMRPSRKLVKFAEVQN